MMEKEFNELRNYFNEARIRTRNDRYNYSVLANYSEKSIEQIEKIKLRLEDIEAVRTCEKAIEELKKVPALVEQYSKKIEYPEMIGDDSSFIDINHTLYNNLEELLVYFDELDKY